MIDEMWVGTAGGAAASQFQIHGGDDFSLVQPGGAKGIGGTPEPRVDHIDRPRTHGVYDLTSYYGARIISLSGICVGDDVGDALDNLDDLKEHLALDGTNPRLWFKRTGRAYYEFCDVVACAALEADFDLPTRVIPWSIDLCAEDPRFYESGDGNDFETATFAATATVTGGGNFNTPPVIRINGAGTNGGVENTSLSSENILQLDAVLIGGDVVEIDCANKTVKKNGVLRPDLLDMSVSSFWKLKRGSNALAKVGGAVSIEIDWFPARV
jgi:hypothetical protein